MARTTFFWCRIAWSLWCGVVCIKFCLSVEEARAHKTKHTVGVQGGRTVISASEDAGKRIGEGGESKPHIAVKRELFIDEHDRASACRSVVQLYSCVRNS